MSRTPLPQAAYTYDLMRSLGGGAPWLLLEQAPRAVNWRARNAAKPPGQMRLWSYQAIAHGADAVMFFQWRQSRGGAERFHSAMVPHGGPDTRTFRETAGLGTELAKLSRLPGSRVEADVALIMDWESAWALENDSHPANDLRQQEISPARYRPLWEARISADVVTPSAELAAYKLVVVPNLYLVDEAIAANLADYVRGGGHLVMSMFSGIVDSNDRVHPGGYPGPLADLLGLRIEEFWPLAEQGETGLAFTDGTAGTGTVRSEWITPAGAETLATFATGELAGRPAITRHRFGDGTAWYLGTRPDPATMGLLLRQAVEAAGACAVLPGSPAGVEATLRRGEDGTRWLFLLNHNTFPVEVTIPDSIDALSGRRLGGRTRLDRRGVLVTELPAPDRAPESTRKLV